MRPNCKTTLVLVLVAACTVGSGDSTGSLSGGSGTSGGTTSSTTTFTPDPEECEPVDCPGVVDDSGGQVEQCCPDFQPDGTLPNKCPNQDYPNDWSCNGQEECVNAGCVNDGDCLIPTMTCRTVDGTNFCIIECDDADTDDDCIEDHDMPDTKCIGEIDTSGDKFCLQEIL